MNVLVMVAPIITDGVMLSRIGRAYIPGLAGFQWDVESFTLVTHVRQNSGVYSLDQYEL